MLRPHADVARRFARDSSTHALLPRRRFPARFSTNDLGAVGLYVTKFTFCSRGECAMRVPLRT